MGWDLLQPSPNCISEMQPPESVPRTPVWPGSLLHAMNGEMNQREALSSLSYIWGPPPSSGGSGHLWVNAFAFQNHTQGGFLAAWSGLGKGLLKDLQNTCQGRDSSFHRHICPDHLRRASRT